MRARNLIIYEALYDDISTQAAKSRALTLFGLGTLNYEVAECEELVEVRIRAPILMRAGMLSIRGRVNRSQA